MGKRVAIDQLHPGMMITQVTQQHGPVKIKKSGLVTSEDMVKGLLEMGVSEVEIDPDLTVELVEQQDTPAEFNADTQPHADSLPNQTAKQSTVSQTKALLQGQYDKQGRYDTQLADQFNRNLFLPSVQGIPSLWMVYLRQGASVLLTVLLGLTIGFLAAKPQLWWSFNEQPNASPSVSVPATPADSNGQDGHSQVAQNEIPDSNSQAISRVPDDVPQQLAPSSAQQSQQSDEDNIAASSMVETPAEQSTGLVTSDSVDQVSNTESQDSSINPELLRRFNQAIAELDSEPNDSSNETKVTVRNDIQRIDQLPVRLMTTLPSMTFTAHMFASRESDRWVRVNGVRMQEGDWIDDRVQIVGIEAQRVVLAYQGELFTMAALTDW